MATMDDAKHIARANITLAREVEDLQFEYESALAGTKALIHNEERGFYLVAEERGAIIGHLMVTFEWSDWRNKTIWWIHRVYIQEQWRGKGVFKQLFHEVKNMALRSNVFALRLYVFQENKEAMKTYEALEMEVAPFAIYQQVLSE